MANTELFKISGVIDVETGQASINIDKVVKQAQTAATNMQTSFAKVGSTLSTVGKTISSAGKTVSGIGTTLSATVTAPITALGVSTAKTAISFLSLKEGARTAFQVLLGDTEKAEKMLDDLYTFAKTTPFSYDTYLTAGKTLSAMGIAAQDVIPYLQSITNAAIATGLGQEGVNSLSQAIGRMASTGKVTLETLNVLTYSGIPAVKILANQYGVTTEEMFKMISAGEVLGEEALPKLLEGMEKGTDGAAGLTAAYGGLAKDMKGTLSGAFDSLHSAFRNAAIEMWNAEEAFPELIKLLQEFKNSIGFLPDIFKALAAAAVPTLQKISEKLKEFNEYLAEADPKQLERVGKIILGLAAAGPVLAIVGKGISALGNTISGLGKVFTGASKAIGFLGPKLSAFAGAVGGTGPAIAIVAAVVVALIGVIKVLKDNWDKVTASFNAFVEKTGLKETFEKIKTAAASLWEKLKGLGDLFTVIGTIILTSLQPLFATLAGLFNGVIKALAPLMDAIGGLLDILGGLGEFIVGVFTGNWQKAWDGIKRIGAGIWDTIKGVFLAIWELISGYFEGWTAYWESLWEGFNIGEKLSSLWNTISTWFVDTWNSISEWFSNLWQTISDWWNGLLADIGNWLSGIWDAITGWLNSVKTWFVDTWNGIVDWLKTAWDNICNVIKVAIMFIGSILDAAWQIITLPFRFIWENCKEYVFAAWEWIKEKVTNAVNKVKDVITKVFNAVKNFFSTIWNGIKTIFTTVWNAIVNFITPIINKLKATFTTWLNNIKSAFTTIWNAVKNVFTTVWNSIVNFVTPIVNRIKSAITTAFNAAKNTVTSIFNAVKNFILSVWNSIKTAVTNAANAVKNAVTNAFNAVKNKVVSIFNSVKSTVINIWNGIKTGISNAANSVKNTVSNIFNKVKDAITKPINAAKDKVKDIIDKIKGFFSNLKLKLPHIKMPHFSIKGKFSLDPPSVPKLNIDWYKKGGIFGEGILTKPTAFGISPSGALRVGGEAGAEAVAPISKLQEYVAAAATQGNAEVTEKLDALISLLTLYLPLLLKRELRLDTDALVGELVGPLDAALGILAKQKERGRA